MSDDTTSTNSSFGRLSWNFTKEFSSTLARCTTWFNHLGATLEVTVIIFFLAQFCRPKSHFRTPYFVIYTIGLASDAFPKCISMGYYFVSSLLFMYMGTPFQWFQANFNAMWNTVLAFNRFTAIVCYYQYSRIWTKTKTALVCGFLFFYPFLVDLYNPARLWCHITGNLCPASIRDTYEETSFTRLVLPTLDCAYALAATMFCLTAVICQSARSKHMDIRVQNIEKILLLQSLLSSICLIISAAFGWLAGINGLGENAQKGPESTRILNLQLALSCISNLFYAVYHYSSLILLFVLS